MHRAVAMCLLLVAAGCGGEAKRDGPARTEGGETVGTVAGAVELPPQPTGEPTRVDIGDCYAPDDRPLPPGRPAPAHGAVPTEVRDDLAVELGAPTIKGSERSVVQQTVERHLPRLRECYAMELAERPELTGKLTVAFDVAATGSVSGIALTGVRGDRLTPCIEAAFAAMVFPARDGTSVARVRYPMTVRLARPGTAQVASADDAAESQSPEAFRARITERLRADTSKLAGCYRSALARRPELFGAITLSFTLDASGRPLAIDATGFADPGTERCITEHVQTLQLDPPEQPVPVVCGLALGLAPVRVLADAGPKIEIAGRDIKADGRVVGDANQASPGGLPGLREALAGRARAAESDPLRIPIATMRAEPTARASVVTRVVSEASAAGFPHLGFQTQREGGEWRYAYLPRLPANPLPRAVQPVFAVQLVAGAIRAGDTTGKRWFLTDVGAERNFPTLADVLRAQRRRPTYAQRRDIELSAADSIRYRDLADAMTLIAAQGFTDIRLVEPGKGAVEFEATTDEPLPTETPP